MYIDNSEPTENVGQIHFSLEYDFQNTTLILKIMQVSFFNSSYLFLLLLKDANQLFLSWWIQSLYCDAELAYRHVRLGFSFFFCCIFESLENYAISLSRRRWDANVSEFNCRDAEMESVFPEDVLGTDDITLPVGLISLLPRLCHRVLKSYVAQFTCHSFLKRSFSWTVGQNRTEWIKQSGW